MISRESVLKSRYETRPLGELVHFLDSQRRPVTAKDRVAGPYPYFGANGQQGTIADYLFDEPLVLLAEDGGHFDQPDRGIAYQVDGKTWVNNHAHVLRATSQVDLGYLTRALECYDVRPFVTGTTRGKLTKAGASRIEIPVPPVHEQRRIASILDQADALRAKRREALAYLDHLAESIFLDMFGDPVANAAGRPMKKLAVLTSKIGSGATPRGGEAAYKKSGVSLIRSMNVRDEGFSRRRLAFIDAQQAQALDGVTVEAGDVLLNITGASVARVTHVPADVLPARVNQHVAILRPTTEISAVFLERLLLTPQMKAKLLSVGGSGATREAITKSEIEALDIIVPTLGEQLIFAEQMSSAEGLRQRNHVAESKLGGLFASLQSRAFAGEL